MSQIHGIRKDGDHWRCFDDDGERPGRFDDAETARWGFWATAEDVERINGAEGRLIDMEDIRARLRECTRDSDTHRMAETPQEVRGEA